MADITVVKVNEVNNKIFCSDSISLEMSEYFSFTVPNAHFRKKDKNGRRSRWNGKIRMFNLRTRQMRIGLNSKLQQFAADRGYSLEFASEEGNTSFSEIEALEFYNSLNLPSFLEKREHQIKAFIHGIRTRRCILLSSTASGKSFVMYLLTRFLLKKTLIIVPRIDLVDQLFGDFKDYGFNSEQFIQRIYGGEEKEITKPIVISTWQSIHELPPEYFANFEVVIGDEVHTFKAKSLMHIMDSLVNCKYRFGLTGSLDDSQINKLTLEGMFGPVKLITTTSEQIALGYAPDLEVKCIVFKYPQEMVKLNSNLSYQDEQEMLFNLESRNQFITKLAHSLKGNTLILFKRLDHGKRLFELISNSDVPTYYVAGAIDKDNRKEIRHLINGIDRSITVASEKVWSTGTNIPNLHNVIFASPSKSRILILQSIGRTLRKTATKNKSVIYDISDDLTFNGEPNVTLKHFHERVRLYVSEKFNYRVYPVSL